MNISFLEQGWPRSQQNKFLKTCERSRALLDEKCKPVAKHLVLSYELQSIVFGNSIEDLSPTSHLSLTWTDYLRQNHLNRLHRVSFYHTVVSVLKTCAMSVWEMETDSYMLYSLYDTVRRHQHPKAWALSRAAVWNFHLVHILQVTSCRSSLQVDYIMKTGH